MEHKFWDQRYTENKWLYGTEPNRFFKAFIDSYKPGRILLPAEGEGRNATYAASKGWQVDAFDFSSVAKQKALKRAEEKGVRINYLIQDIEDFSVDRVYDAVGLLYVHLPQKIRQAFHQKYINLLSLVGTWFLKHLPGNKFTIFPVDRKMPLYCTMPQVFAAIFLFCTCYSVDKRKWS